MKMEQTECSEMSAHKIRTLGIYPKEKMQYCHCSQMAAPTKLWGCSKLSHEKDKVFMKLWINLVFALNNNEMYGRCIHLSHYEN